MNAAKSCFVIGINSHDRDIIIQIVTGCQKKELPIIYLGCPIYVGRMTRRRLQPILDKLQCRLEGWKGKYMSAGAELIILIKHVLQAVPIHYTSLIQSPPSTIN